jgi:hypothetical protein
MNQDGSPPFVFVAPATVPGGLVRQAVRVCRAEFRLRFPFLLRPLTAARVQRNRNEGKAIRCGPIRVFESCH